ncbi:MAG: aspartate-semialdehyde dehydrogenase, partial [Eggerthellaceae bacterium]|nr:aspartate-semialdehyde dehydrogenase [Eggerthellaceae bacterium]
MNKNPVVAVCGATGAVGREFMNVLHDVDFPASQVKALASARSAGSQLAFGGCGQVPAGSLTVEEMKPESFEGVDIALFSAGASVSKELRQAVVDAGAVMVDNSSAFRMDEDVPLVVPEVNPQDVEWHQGVIA